MVLIYFKMPFSVASTPTFFSHWKKKTLKIKKKGYKSKFWPPSLTLFPEMFCIPLAFSENEIIGNWSLELCLETWPFAQKKRIKLSRENREYHTGEGDRDDVR